MATFSQNILLLTVFTVIKRTFSFSPTAVTNYTAPADRFVEVSIIALTTTDTDGTNFTLAIDGIEIVQYSKLGSLEISLVLNTGQQLVATSKQGPNSEPLSSHHISFKEFKKP